MLRTATTVILLLLAVGCSPAAPAGPVSNLPPPAPAPVDVDCDEPPAAVTEAISARLRDPALVIEPYAYVDLTSYSDPPVYLVAAHVNRADGSRVTSAELWAVSTLRPDAEVFRLFGEELTDAPDFYDVATDVRAVEQTRGPLSMDCIPRAS